MQKPNTHLSGRGAVVPTWRALSIVPVLKDTFHRFTYLYFLNASDRQKFYQLPQVAYLHHQYLSPCCPHGPTHGFPLTVCSATLSPPMLSPWWGNFDFSWELTPHLFHQWSPSFDLLNTQHQFLWTITKPTKAGPTCERWSSTRNNLRLLQSNCQRIPDLSCGFGFWR